MYKILTRAVAVAILIFSNFIFLSAQSEVPAGTRITVRMDNGINSESAAVDDTFTAATVSPVRVGGAGAIPAETVVIGRVTKAKTAESGGRPGQLEVEFTRMRFANGTERDISAVLVKNVAGKSPGPFNALAILTSTAIGGIIGLVSKARNGALIGAGIGAGAGTGVALSRNGKDVGIGSNEEFEIELTKAVTLPADGF